MRVIIESPYAGDVETNTRYARACMRDSLLRGEAPYASHLLYTQMLDDTIPEEREIGIKAGFVWGEMADKVVVYLDLGVSNGMKRGMTQALDRGIPIEHRSLASWSPTGHHYTVEWSVEDQAYIGRVKEYPSLAAHSEYSALLALKEIQSVVIDVIDIEDGETEEDEGR